VFSAWQRLCIFEDDVRDRHLAVAFAGATVPPAAPKMDIQFKSVKLRDTRLRTRLVGGFLLMAAIAASIGLMGITSLRAMRRADLALYERSTVPLPAIAHISVSFLKIRIALRDLLAASTLDDKEVALREIERVTEDLDISIARYDLRNLSLEERTLFDRFTAARKAYADFEGEIVAAAMAGMPEKGWRILRGPEYAKVRNVVLGSLEQIESLKVFDARDSINHNTALVKTFYLEMAIAMALGVALALGAGMALTLSITQPIERVVRVLVAVASGDLDQRLEIDSHDEIGQMSKTLNLTISELKKTRQELVAAREAALAASQAKSEFLSSMSHEIRTPMNAVLGMGELLGETELNSEQRRYLTVMNSNGESLLELINSILDLAKIESGRLQLESADFDLNDLVDKLLATFGSRAHIKGLELAARIAPGVSEHLVGDQLRLRQVLINLIGNALKFTEIGEVTLVIDNNPEATEAGQLRFTVSDTGIGIPANKLDSVFSSFTQVDSSTTRKYGGTGLGLTIAQRLVSLMGGEIRVESTFGMGSKFIFTANFGVAAGTLATLPDGVPDLSGFRVLVVDDNATNREILCETMLGAGAEVEESGSGVEALAAVQLARDGGRPYQMILLDMRMPGMDGLEVATRIRRKIQSDAPFIIMLSSDDVNPQLSRMRELGLDAFLIKPIARRELFDAISRLVAQSKSPGIVKFVKADDAPAVGLDVPAARILVAEDSADNRMVISAFLKRTPCQLDFAENGQIALEKFTDNHYDLVLMDMQMPVMDGYVATRSIRDWEREHRAPHTNIVALTASAMDEDMVKARAAGCDEHIGKPMKKATLLEVIRKYAADPARANGIAVAIETSAKRLS
jgi:two-component system sensor histidine kinase/response regulator